MPAAASSIGNAFISTDAARAASSSSDVCRDGKIHVFVVYMVTGAPLLNIRMSPSDYIMQLKQHIKAKLTCSSMNLTSDDGRPLFDTDTLEDAGVRHGSQVRAIIMSHRLLTTASYDGRIRVWDLESGECQRMVEGPVEMSAVGLSPDAQTFVAGTCSWNAKVFDAREGDFIKALKGHESTISCVQFSPDGRHIATGSFDFAVKIWETDDYQCLGTLRGHELHINWVSFSRNSKFLATASGDSTARVWDLQTHGSKGVFKASENPVLSAAFSPDSVSLVTTDGNFARIWSVETKELISILTGHLDLVTFACYSLDGLCLATASKDSTARVWELETGISRQTLAGHGDAVNTIAFSLDGQYVVTTSADKAAKVWQVNTGDCCKSFDRHRQEVIAAAFVGN